MNEPQPSNHWADGQSFIGGIYLLEDGKRYPVHPFKTHHDLSFGVDIHVDDGWLKVGGSAGPSLFLFRFHSRGENRLHFKVALASNSRRKLGISDNGYLGLYDQTDELDYWKLQPVEWSKDELRCLIRDHQGHQVKIESVSGLTTAHLTIGEGVPHEFMIVRSH